jgi:ATP-dependent DNA helicase RecQ
VRSDALRILADLTGRADATFHPGQMEAIEALVVDHRRALVVQRTGWGKSAVYFIAALLQRRAGAGPALIVSPLLALMRDQVAAAERAGVRAQAINSANVTEWSEIERLLDDDAVDVLFVSPERLVNPRFRESQLPRLVASCGLLVIDEAHCISDWGHDFRPDYRRIGDLIEELPTGVPVLATTATANERVVADVAEQLAHDSSARAGTEQRVPAPTLELVEGASAPVLELVEGASAPVPELVEGSEVFTLRGPLARASLRLGVLDLGTPWRRLAWLREHLATLPGSGIIYCLTVAAAEDTAAMLAKAGYAVRSYTGRTDPAERLEAEEDLKANRVKALVATSALGMGFDKPDLGFVVHLGAPSSPVAYYQQVGRAGRATDSADVLLLPGIEDREIWHWFATNAMPTQPRADRTLAALAEASGPLSIAALEARVDLKRGPLELLLKVLAVEGAVEAVPGGWAATGKPWSYDADRYGRIADGRVAEQRAMIAYETHEGCRMRFLTEALDDPAAADCGRCDRCAGVWYPTAISEVAADAAKAAVDRVGVPIEPRSLWPTGLDRLGVLVDGSPLKGKVTESERCEEGLVLARLSDLGWGGPLRDLLRSDEAGRPIDPGDLPPTLVPVVLRVLKEWDWAERPTAVVAIPSLSRPRLVRSLASGIASAGRLADLGALGLRPAAGPLNHQVNSAYRVADLWERFVVSNELASAVADHVVLVVDDRVDSRWTMTVIGRLLRRANAKAVLPFSLAMAG